MCRLAQAATKHVLAAESLESLAPALYKLHAFNSARWLQRVSDILAARLTALEVVHPEQHDIPGTCRTTSSRVVRSIDGLQRRGAKNEVERTVAGSLPTRKFDSTFPSGDVPAFEHGARHTDPIQPR